MAKSDRNVMWLLAAVLIGSAVITYLLGGFALSFAQAERKYSPEILPIEKDEAHLLALDREALDKAYKDHIGLVFGVWMKDPTDPEAPRRAGNGARNARKGYSISRDRIEEREQKLKESKQ